MNRIVLEICENPSKFKVCMNDHINEINNKECIDDNCDCRGTLFDESEERVLEWTENILDCLMNYGDKISERAAYQTEFTVSEEINSPSEDVFINNPGLDDVKKLLNSCLSDRYTLRNVSCKEGLVTFGESEVRRMMYALSEYPAGGNPHSLLLAASLALHQNISLYGLEGVSGFVDSRAHWFKTPLMSMREIRSALIINLGEVIGNPNKGFSLKPIASIYAIASDL